MKLMFGQREVVVGLAEVVHGPLVRVVFVECDELYNREDLYWAWR